MSAIISEQEFQDCIDKISRLPKDLEAAIGGLSDAQLSEPYREGGWSSRQVVHHLADSHINAYIRTKLVFTEINPTLKPYEQDAWAMLADNAAPIETSLQILRGVHERWTLFLKSVPYASLSRTGFHLENGEMTLSQILTSYAKHGATHVEQILGLRKKNGW
jgi:hypothetical protein